jgi:hypothetical protein
MSIPNPLKVEQGGTGANTLTGVVIGTDSTPLTAVALPEDATKYFDGTGAFSTPPLTLPASPDRSIQINDSGAFGSQNWLIDINGTLLSGEAQGGGLNSIAFGSSLGGTLGVFNANSLIFGKVDSDVSSLINNGADTTLVFGSAETAGSIEGNEMNSLTFGHAITNGSISSDEDAVLVRGLASDNGVITADGIASTASGVADGTDSKIFADGQAAMVNGTATNGGVVTQGGENGLVLGSADGAGSQVSGNNPNNITAGAATAGGIVGGANAGLTIGSADGSGSTIGFGNPNSFTLANVSGGGEIGAYDQAVAWGKSTGGRISSQSIASLTYGEVDDNIASLITAPAGDAATANGLAINGGVISAEGTASYARGKADGSGETGTLSFVHAGGVASTAIGIATGPEGVNGAIDALGDASFAGGFAQFGTIQAVGTASFVWGVDSLGPLNALGYNTIVFGSAVTGVNDNSFTVGFGNVQIYADSTGEVQLSSIDESSQIQLGNSIPITFTADNGLNFGGSVGTAGQVLTSGGTGTTPLWEDPTSVNIYNSDGSLTADRTVSGAHILNINTDSLNTVTNNVFINTAGSNTIIGSASSTFETTGSASDMQITAGRGININSNGSSVGGSATSIVIDSGFNLALSFTNTLLINGAAGNVGDVITSNGSGAAQSWQPGPLSGSFSSGAAGATNFTVSIGVTEPSTTYKVQVTPTNALSALPYYVTNKTTTTFDVIYLTGITGTVGFDWTVFP